MIFFPASGVEAFWWLPLVAGFVVSVFCSLGGVSGAFLLLPFQVSFLNFTGPAVSATNLLFNIFAIPSGVYRYAHEKRMVLPLAWIITLGTLPGVFIGAFIRIFWLPDPRNFKLFVAAVLAYIGIRIFRDILHPRPKPPTHADCPFTVSDCHFGFKYTSFVFAGEAYRVPTHGVGVLCFIVGIIGGVYGIGGGAIVSPFLVSVFGLPIHAVAGVALLGTFITSVAGVAFYALIAPCYSHLPYGVCPDWALGSLFGLGGAAGMYLGARLQKRMPERYIKLVLIAAMGFIVVKYCWEFSSGLLHP